jgi:hypothetical protein
MIGGASMGQSRLQTPFVEEVARTFQATQARIVRRLSEKPSTESVESILEGEFRGLYHGLFVMLDGGTALANEGLISVVDEDGVAFDRFLHEICFGFWPNQRD